MDFYEHQDAARRHTLLLFALMAVAVAGIAVGVYCIVYAVVAFKQPDLLVADPAQTLFDPRLFAITTIATTAFILLGSLYKTLLLRGSGQAVARMLGGRQVQPDPRDKGEQTLMHVVEEMAIASGAPVPAVFVMDGEAMINAFAAGRLYGEPAIAVTRGALDKLSRDELQGVVAHEFSHLVHDDGAINVRLIGTLHGIMLIYLLGYYMLRIMAHGSRRKGTAGLALAGVGLMAVGGVGMLCANVIKAAVSRQREFLADAAAVQYTRNPIGLGGALRKIAIPMSSKVAHRDAPAASHLFFGAAVALFPATLFATHPPIHERIRRVCPGMEEGVMTEDDFVERLGNGPDFAKPLTGAGAREGARQDGFAEALEMIPHAAGAALAPAVGAVGAAGAMHQAYAQRIVETLPEPLLKAVRSPGGARAAMLAMLAGRDGALTWGEGGESVSDETARLVPLVEGLDSCQRMVLLSKSEMALRGMSFEDFESLRDGVVALVEADGEVDLFEWMLGRMLLHRLGSRHGGGAKASRHYSLGPLAAQCGVVLSCLAHAGSEVPDVAAKALRTGWTALGLRETKLLVHDDCSLQALDKALDVLGRATPALKSKILAACAATIAADKQVTPDEGLLFQGIADALGVPVPPLLPGQPLV